MTFEQKHDTIPASSRRCDSRQHTRLTAGQVIWSKKQACPTTTETGRYVCDTCCQVVQITCLERPPCNFIHTAVAHQSCAKV